MHDNLKSEIPYVLVTGGSTGLGWSISKNLVKNGYGVISLSPNSSDYNVQLENFISVDADASDYNSMVEKLTELKKKSINLIGIVNNAGKSKWKPMKNVDLDFVQDIFSANIFTSIITVRSALEVFNNVKSIVNISSLAGKRGTANNSIYVAAKFAINGLTAAWCKELGHKQIRVNAICPVLIMTPGLSREIENEHGPAHEIGVDKFLANFEQNETALKKLPSGEDVGDLVSFLISEKSQSISGQFISVDSGVLPG